VKRILIVDDEDDIREILRMSLEMLAGWEVLEAHTGVEAISIALHAQPDAILLDMMMPGMDGIAVFEQLQGSADTRNIPVILLTAKTQPADRRRFSHLGLSAVVSKPFDPVALPGTIADLLGWNSAAQRPA
jgi:CheY-like chemotaxis protein